MYQSIVRLGTKSRKEASLDGGAIDDLLTISILAPLLRTNMRARVSTEILSSDASEGSRPWLGGANTTVSHKVADELFRTRRKRRGDLYDGPMNPSMTLLSENFVHGEIACVDAVKKRKKILVGSATSPTR